MLKRGDTNTQVYRGNTQFAKKEVGKRGNVIVVERKWYVETSRNRSRRTGRILKPRHPSGRTHVEIVGLGLVTVLPFDLIAHAAGSLLVPQGRVLGPE